MQPFLAHNLRMSGSRRPNRAAYVAMVALLLAVPLAAGCGSSSPSASAPTLGSSAAADPPKAPSVAGGASPGGAKAPSAMSSSAVTPADPKPRRPVPPAHPVPAAFRPAPGAPSDAEVERELAQMAAVERQQRQQALSAAAADLAGLLPWSLESKSGTQVSVASVFADYGLGLACGGVLGREQLGVAHKTAPCGTLITFTYAGRSLTVPVIDRGPYIAGREWDLTGATAAALAFPGLAQIQWSIAL
jgi:rare lipoprotein A (peptidoglycan hydrolase)